MPQLMMDAGLEFNKKLNLYLGILLHLPASYEKGWLLFKVLWRLYSCGGGVMLMLIIFALLIKAFQETDNLAVFCTSSGCASYLIQTPLKLLIFKSHGKTTTAMLRDMEVTTLMLLENPLGKKDFKDLYNKHYGLIRRIAPRKALFEFLAGTFLIGFYACKCLLYDDTSKLPAALWMPFDFTSKPRFLMVCLVFGIALSVGLVRNTGLDAMFFSMLVVPSVQLRYLKRLMKAIMAASPENGESVMQLKTQQQQDMSDNLLWWANVHQRILRNMQEMKSFSSPYLVLTYSTMMFCWLIVAVIIFSTSSWDTVQKMSVSILVGANMLQLYYLSTVGDNLQEISFTVADDAYDIKMLKCSPLIRKNYIFVLMRSKKEFFLRAFYLVPLASDSFAKLVRITFSYFVAIVQIRQRKNLSSSF